MTEVNHVLKDAVQDLLPMSMPQMKLVWITVKVVGKAIRISWYVYENVRLNRANSIATMGFGYSLEGIGGQYKTVQTVTQVVFATLMVEKTAEQLATIHQDLTKCKNALTGRDVIYVQRSNSSHSRGVKRPRMRLLMLKKGSLALLDIPVCVFKMSMYFWDAKAAVVSTDPSIKREYVKKVALYSGDIWRNLNQDQNTTYQNLHKKKHIVNSLMKKMDAPWSARLLMKCYSQATQLDKAKDVVEEMEEIFLTPILAVSDSVEMMVEGAQVVYHKALIKTKLLMHVPKFFIPEISRSFHFYFPGQSPDALRFIKSPKWEVINEKKRKPKRKLIKKATLKKKKVKKREETSVKIKKNLVTTVTTKITTATEKITKQMVRFQLKSKNCSIPLLSHEKKKERAQIEGKKQKPKIVLEVVDNATKKKRNKTKLADNLKQKAVQKLGKYAAQNLKEVNEKNMHLVNANLLTDAYLKTKA